MGPSITSGRRLSALTQLAGADEDVRHAIDVVSTVLPFKINSYVLSELIDWDNVPDDPIYRLTFPHRDMLPPESFEEISNLLHRKASSGELRSAADRWRGRLNPSPSSQLEENIPQLAGRPVSGLQHKYSETVLIFPSPGQTCHSYCAYCFRWAQFVGIQDLKQGLTDPQLARAYLQAHPEVSDVLFTGGDPMVMSTAVLRSYVSPILEPGLEHIRSVRFGTKAVAYWPYRFTSDPDARALLNLFEEIIATGRSVDIMLHLSHPREVESAAAQEAVRLIRSTGAVLRSQAPLVRHVNDRPEVWADMWRKQVNLGIFPYYFFVERDTGANRYFSLPLERAVKVYQEAVQRVSGLARTARGPVMSAAQGKVVIDDITVMHGQKVIVCRFLQARDPSWCGRTFLATGPADATWFSELRPLPGSPSFWSEGT